MSWFMLKTGKPSHIIGLALILSLIISEHCSSFISFLNNSLMLLTNTSSILSSQISFNLHLFDIRKPIVILFSASLQVVLFHCRVFPIIIRFFVIFIIIFIIIIVFSLIVINFANTVFQRLDILRLFFSDYLQLIWAYMFL